MCGWGEMSESRCFEMRELESPNIDGGCIAAHVGRFQSVVLALMT